MKGNTNATSQAITTFIPTDSEYCSFNSTYSSCQQVGNIVLVSLGGCACSNTNDQAVVAMTGFPKAAHTVFAPIFSHYNGYCGYFRIDANSGNLNMVTLKATGTDITMQFTYIALTG